MTRTVQSNPAHLGALSEAVLERKFDTFLPVIMPRVGGG
jgi:hypothetical protein